MVTSVPPDSQHLNCKKVKSQIINMDYKKSKAPVNTVTRNIMDLCKETGNIYESVAII